MKQHKMQYTATGIAGIALVIVLALMVNWIAAKRWVRKDVTSSQMYTVSDRTGNLLADLNDPVEIIVFMTPATPLFEQVRELLRIPFIDLEEVCFGALVAVIVVR